jgi:FeS assembly protein IscX
MINWTDSLEIAISLDESHPDIDPTAINFVDLRELVMTLEDFNEGDTHCGEKV